MIPVSKLRCGRVVYGHLRNSFGNKSTQPHYAIVLDSREQVKEALQTTREIFVVGISHNDDIDSEFIIPVPKKHHPIEGFVVCSWVPTLPLSDIVRVQSQVFSDLEMAEILKRINEAIESRRKRRGGSTQS